MRSEESINDISMSLMCIDEEEKEEERVIPNGILMKKKMRKLMPESKAPILDAKFDDMSKIRAA
jgi:hypothetical protein